MEFFRFLMSASIEHDDWLLYDVCVCTQTFVSSISLKPYIKSEVSQYVRKLKLAK